MQMLSMLRKRELRLQSPPILHTVLLNMQKDAKPLLKMFYIDEYSPHVDSARITQYIF